MNDSNGMHRKVRRAEQHLEALQQLHNSVTRIGVDWDIPVIQDRSQALAESEGGGEMFKLFGTAADGSTSIELRQFVRHTPIPDEFATTFGDLLFNLRSALDHAVWALHSPANQTSRVEFPVCLAAENWADLSARKIGTLSGTERDALKSMQPFEAADPSSDPLWLLHELNRVDKHRVLHVADHRIAGGYFNSDDSWVDEDGERVFPVATYRVALLGSGLSVDGEPILTVASSMVAHVRDVLMPQLGALLPN
jgi:hypothetical protein